MAYWALAGVTVAQAVDAKTRPSSAASLLVAQPPDAPQTLVAELERFEPPESAAKRRKVVAQR